jgi:hypothetical protein
MEQAGTGKSKDDLKAPISVYDIVPIPLYIPPTTGTPRISTPIKIATPDLILPLKETAVPADTMADMIFENIGGQEILNVGNTDFTEEIDIEYQPIKNLRDIYLSHSPSSLVGFTDESEIYLSNFSINLNDYEPNENLTVNNGYMITTTKRLAIINATPDGTNVTYQTQTAHKLSPGDTVGVYGIYPTAYNTSVATEVILTPSDTQFVLANTTTEEYVKSNLIYIDQSNGDLVIEFVDIPDGTSVEVEVWQPDEYFDTTRPLDGIPATKPPL